MNQYTEQCYICAGAAALVREERAVQIGRRSVVVAQEFMLCRECGEEYYLPGQMDAAQIAASTRIRDDLGLLQPEEIRSIRNKLGVSQADFERLIGAGHKTVVRWEKGTVFQNGTADTLLRVLGDHPYVARDLARRRGVNVQIGVPFPRTYRSQALERAERELLDAAFVRQPVRVRVGDNVALELDGPNTLFSVAA